MPYVPPHLRSGGSAPSDDPPPSSNRGGGGGGGWGSSSRGADSGGFRDRDRDRDYGSFGSRNGRGDEASQGGPSRRERPLESKSQGPPEPTWPKWAPSERVQKLDDSQILEVRNRLNVTVEEAIENAKTPAAIESFEDMSLHTNILKDIVYHSYTSPTPIQAQAMPIALSGRDILGCAQTGSGKTAAFAIPLVQHCLNQPPLRHGDGPLALVLAPTRELAQQIEAEVKAFSRSCPGFRTAIIVGGTQMSDQKGSLRMGVEVVVATPGRLIDHLHQGNTSLSRVSFIVLDEADRMLDMGFEPQMREIMRGVPAKHQTLLFSATMPVEIESLAQEYLKDPSRVKVGRVSSPTANVTQQLEKVAEKDKVDRLLQILVEEAAVADSTKQAQPLTIVFVERKANCDSVADAIVAQGLHAAALHGGRSQGEREAALRDFRQGKTNILVATDVASRGLDVSGVAHVINMDLPKALEDYVHRIGRTGRAGASGRATSFHTDRDAFLVTQIRKAIAEVEAGNDMAFATGKSARAKEKEAAAQFREGKQLQASVVPSIQSLSSKYRHMMVAPTLTDKKAEGKADDAWDD